MAEGSDSASAGPPPPLSDDSPAHLGYLALAALVGAESAGIPLPGETALIAAALLSHDGQLRIELVLPIAAAAAILGDNIGT